MSRATITTIPAAVSSCRWCGERRLPILLEESFENTLFFLNELAPDLPVVIPHLGGLNGGYCAQKAAAGVWNRPQTYTDSSTAALAEIEDFLGRYGSDRLLFGSDHPFVANRNSNWPRSST